MLILKNITISVENTITVEQFNLSLAAGSLHLLSGPNGSGKSSVVQLLLGNPIYKLNAGSVMFKGHDLMALKPHERVQNGLFIVQQEAVEIPGLAVLSFLKAAYDALGCPKQDTVAFVTMVKDVLKKVGLDESFMERSINQGFSGGQKKRFELAQLLLFKPSCIIFDEIDAGLDVDGQQLFINILHELHASGQVAIVCISHNRQLFSSFNDLTVHHIGATLDNFSDASGSVHNQVVI
jgi:Fe-S cluster assembly ATP-binding protein